MRHQLVSLESVHAIRVHHATLVQLILLWLSRPYNQKQGKHMCVVEWGLSG